MKSYLDIQKCDCGRPWCQYFYPLEGEYGASINKTDIEHIIKTLKEYDIQKQISHLENLIN